MRSQEGVIEVDASYREGKAMAEFDPALVTAERIADAINTRTYYRASVLSVEEGPFAPFGGEEAQPKRTATATIFVQGMTDDRAASQVLAAMGNPAVTDVSVDTGRSQLAVVYDPSRVAPSFFVSAINNQTPFRASLSESSGSGTGGGGVTPLWLIGGGSAIVGAATLSWYAFARTRRPAVARAERRRRTKRR